MQGDKQVVAKLNEVLTSELTSITQYFLHARMFTKWGVSGLLEKNYKIVCKPFLNSSLKLLFKLLYKFSFISID